MAHVAGHDGICFSVDREIEYPVIFWVWRKWPVTEVDLNRFGQTLKLVQQCDDLTDREMGCCNVLLPEENLAVLASNAVIH